MLKLSREAHTAIANMKVEAFKTLQEYRRLPRVPNELKADKAFSPFETFVLATFNAMVEQHHVARERAADICTAGATLLAERWREIGETRAAGKSELLFGRVTVPGTREQGGGPRPVFGTLEEIAAEHGDAAMTIITVSVSRVASQIRARAAEHEIDIEQFWAEPFPVRASKTKPRKKGPRR